MGNRVHEIKQDLSSRREAAAALLFAYKENRLEKPFPELAAHDFGHIASNPSSQPMSTHAFRPPTRELINKAIAYARNQNTGEKTASIDAAEDIRKPLNIPLIRDGKLIEV